MEGSRRRRLITDSLEIVARSKAVGVKLRHKAHQRHTLVSRAVAAVSKHRQGGGRAACVHQVGAGYRTESVPLSGMGFKEGRVWIS